MLQPLVALLSVYRVQVKLQLEMLAVVLELLNPLERTAFIRGKVKAVKTLSHRFFHKIMLS